ncbi:FadR/GntR family transcriptional regulator [Naumannella cuiyingiana]|uniref:DNA-binding transcriptional MocR family regulator n=1 Tax=Naumannella cuiyingiana TaxID=1347891 RepID=A0A7Z0D6F5_9ACTN|nr:GntR family transcriptional regulator [Naumannella cuiyingiana]NYI69673.1 DNA-binding transcriptional MocR family regulator [Naumannella cuiyingiana]
MATSGPGPLARPPLYEQLAEHISAFIDAQGLGPGDRLPPERALASELGVSRATLSRALVALEVRGLVSVQHGNGAVVLGRVDPDHPWATGRLAPPQLAGLRASLVSGLARLAAERAGATAREAMLAPDGTPPTWPDLWRALRRLADDEALATAVQEVVSAAGGADPDTDALTRLAAAVRSGRPELAAEAAWGLW